jgi:hypothetical protein
MGQIMESRTPIDQVLSATCFGGRVREALDGEPSGVVGGYLYAGARQVAAALVGLPDDWTMLLSILIHQAWRDSGDLAAAAAEARRQLASGDWFPDTERLFVETAGPALAEWEVAQQLLLPLLAAFNEERWDKLLAPLAEAEPDSPFGSLQRLRAACADALSADPAGLAAEAAAVLVRIRPDLVPRPLHPDVQAVLDARIPPQPTLGTLTHAIRVFGEGGRIR